MSSQESCAERSARETQEIMKAATKVAEFLVAKPVWNVTSAVIDCCQSVYEHGCNVCERIKEAYEK